MNNCIEQYMKQLKLGAIVKGWRNIEYIDNEQYLTELLELEIRERNANRINRSIKSAGFRVLKTLNDFEWRRNIEFPKGLSRESMENLDFLNKKENLIFMGSVGTGKTHLATALALKTCYEGHNVKFYTAAALAGELLERNAKGTFYGFQKAFKKADLVVIDEIGFVPLHKEASELLFQVISDCYERKSLIITSNLSFSQWNTVFGDDKLSAALIDRLIHHSHIVIFSGDSYRLEQSMKRQTSV